MKKNIQNKSPVLISVIVPVFNTAEWLKTCLASITNQTLRDIEIILIDDGSDDNSVSICSDYMKQDDRICLFTQKHLGAGAARNKGLQIAKGEYVIFLDSDDFFEWNMLEMLYRKAQATKTDITFCDWWITDELGQTNTVPTYSVKQELLPDKDVFSWVDCPSSIFQLKSAAPWFQLYRRDFLLKNGLSFQNQHNCNDLFFTTAAMIAAERIAFLNARLIHYRKLSTSTTAKREKDYKAGFRAVMEVENFLRKKGLYDILKGSFLKFACENILNARTLKEPIVSFWKRILKDEAIPHFDFLGENKQYLSQLQVNMLKKICEQKNISKTLENFYNNSREKIVPVIYTITWFLDAYKVAVSIQSVMEHADKNRFYDIYVLHDGHINEDTVARFEMLSHSMCRVSCINIEDKLSADLKGHVGSVIFELDKILYGYEKVICLDMHSIVQNDIALLFDTDLKDAVIGGMPLCFNKSVSDYCLNTLYLLPNECIKNKVLLINLKQWHKQGFNQDITDILAVKQQYKNFVGDLLNILVREKLCFLPATWGYEPNEVNEYTDCYRDLTAQTANLVIFNNDVLNADKADADLWWGYARKSPFYESLLRRLMSDIASLSFADAQKKLQPFQVKPSQISTAESVVSSVSSGQKKWYRFFSKKKSF